VCRGAKVAKADERHEHWSLDRCRSSTHLIFFSFQNFLLENRFYPLQTVTVVTSAIFGMFLTDWNAFFRPTKIRPSYLFVFNLIAQMGINLRNYRDCQHINPIFGSLIFIFKFYLI